MGELRGPIFLIGFMGAGKTTVGTSLAFRLGWDFIDLDDLVVESEGRSIARIFDEDGESHFRDLELRLLVSLEGGHRLVVACGGGTYAREEGRTVIDGMGRAIWLRIPLSRALERCADGTERPLLGDPARVEVLYRERLRWYRTAPYNLDTEGLTPEQAAEKIVSMLTTGEAQ